MLFNSYEFIFAFLPVTVAGFFLLGNVSRAWALHWLILVSLLFYGWWRPLNILIMTPSILINFGLARTLERLGKSQSKANWSRVVLLLGIVFNVLFLGYFKYLNFFEGTINDVFGANLVLTHVILPLGISFITFQKIAFLIDVHAKRIKSFTLQEYALFVLFFPQLIAGPIVHFGEMMPQFRSAPCRFEKENVSVALTLFFAGLFKKVFLADHLAPLVTPIYEQAAAGGNVSFLTAWMAALGFTLQIYFDFSGYSDMALGLGRFFGIRLPANFNSPLKASSIIEFWGRWHMTLTRFLTSYIYNPLVLALTRRLARKGRPGFGGRNMTIGAFVQASVFPTLLTMFVSGLWHGAGYLFILWGLLHGVFISVNNGWRLIARRLWADRATYERWMTPVGFVLTFLAVTVSMAVFRSTTIETAINLGRGLIGLNGIALPQGSLDQLGPLSGWLSGIGVVPERGDGGSFAKLAFWIPPLMFIALACPNTLEVLSRYEPALGVKPRPIDRSAWRIFAQWDTSFPWALAVSGIAAIGIFFLGSQTVFLYWQF